MTHLRTPPPLVELSAEDVFDVVEGEDVTTTRPRAVPIAANRGCTHTLVGNPSPVEDEDESPPLLKSPPKTLFLTISDTSRTGARERRPMIDETDAGEAF